MLAVDLWWGIEWPMEVPEEGVTRKGILKPLQCNEKHCEDTKNSFRGSCRCTEMVRVLVYSRRNRQIFKYKKAPGST